MELSKGLAHERFDVVAIGALNVDHVIRIEHGDTEFQRRIAAICPDIRWNSETCVNSKVFLAIEKAVWPQIVTTRLGGSSFNALRAIAAIEPELRVGFVGAIGVSAQTAEFMEWFERNRVEVPFVTIVGSGPSGGCIVIEQGEERTLITTRGANDVTTKTLRTRSAEFISWAAMASVIHVSSLLDSMAPAILADVLAGCRESNPTLEITLDPGADWAARYGNDPSIRRLLDMATLIFVNREEFDRIWAREQGSPDCFAARIGSGIGPTAARVLLKEPDRLTLFAADGGVLQTRPHRRLSSSNIVNPTGAGDVLAGAFLVALLRAEPFDVAGLAATQKIVEAWLQHGRVAERKFQRLFESSFRSECGDRAEDSHVRV